MQEYKSLSEYFEEAIGKFWGQQSLVDMGVAAYSYTDVARKIVKLHILFDNAGLKPGDKIALCGKNSAHWAVVFVATVGYGAVIVPILHEFKSENIHHLVNHSEAKLLFVDDTIYENLDPSIMESLSGIFNVEGFHLLYSRSEKLTEARLHLNEIFGRLYPERFKREDLKFYRSKPEDLTLLSYTSGSTGFSKGVMVSDRALTSNLRFTRDHIDFLKPEDEMLLMLPMAHMYGLVVEFIFPFSIGCRINFLMKAPSPQVLLKAFAAIRPKMIVAVPLILEKIIRTRVFPLLEKPLMRIMLHVPYIDTRLLGKIKDELLKSFGGNLHQIIIGGAALNKEVEDFLRRINFPYTVGYGMTECAPLISYAPWNETKLGSCGKVVDRMTVRVASDNPATVPGVVWVKGDNVMLGYYKNEEATGAVLDKDGWLDTGDIGCIDNGGFLFLKGRDKNMILGPSGQNIYPEEIEQILNNMPYVGESLVIEENGKLTALVYPDLDSTNKQHLSNQEIDRIMEENLQQLNKELPAYSKVSKIQILNEEFQKTPKRSIKRYLYQAAK